MFRYRLPEAGERGCITVTDLDGRTVASFAVEGESGHVTWNTVAVKPGIYFYALVSDSVSLPVKRLAIVH